MIPISLKDDIEVIKMGVTIDMVGKNINSILEERHIFFIRRGGCTFACVRNQNGIFIDLTIDQCHRVWQNHPLETIRPCPTVYYDYRMSLVKNSAKSSKVDFNDCMILTEAEQFSEYRY